MSLTANIHRCRSMGCEYEFALPLIGAGGGADVQRVLAQYLTANGVPAISRGYSHELVPPNAVCAVEYDSSVRGEIRYNGVTWCAIELKTRIVSYDEWEEFVPKALEICRYMGGRVNVSCGHHVHISLEELIARPCVVRSLYSLIRRFEPVIYGLVAPSRRTNGYCRSLPPMPHGLDACETISCAEQALAILDRRHGLNFTNLWGRSPHIEFRYHHGTLDAEKARHWLRFCLQLVEHAVTRNCHAVDTPVVNDRKGLEKLLVCCGFKPNNGIYGQVCPEIRETGRYLLRRWKHFNAERITSPNTSEESEE